MHRGVILGVVCLGAVFTGQRSAVAAWPPEGVPLCSNCNVGGGPFIVSDRTGGAYVAWTRSGGDVSLQRVTAAGEIAPGWPAEGLPVCTAPEPQDLYSIAPDGLGGLLLAWTDHRNSGPSGTTSLDIYVQRVRPNGTLAPGWPVNGVPVSRAPGEQVDPVVCPDGLGGAFVSWTDRNTYDVYLQHLGPTGTPAPGWASSGLTVCVEPSVQGAPHLVSDGSGGVIILWGDLRDGPVAAYAQRVLADGTIAAGWPTNGVRIVLGRYIRGLMPDGAGGAYLACATIIASGDDDYFLQRFTGNGAITPGWPAGGAAVCQAPNSRQGLRMALDGGGGVLLTWGDSRTYPEDLYLLRMHGDGTRSPGWPVDGLRVTDNTLFDSVPNLASDGMGGAYLSWDRYFGPTVGDRLVLQHLTGMGTFYPGWPTEGLVVPSDTQVFGGPMTEDGMGGAIVAWVRGGDNNLRALRLGPDGPVAVQISLVSAEAEPGQVRLAWFVADGASFAATVERRTESGEWEQLARVSPDGGGRIEYQDRDVTPGTRYGYRLAYVEEETVRFTVETWVSVPRLELALGGFQPNPSVGVPTVAFVLPEAAPATLEAYDVAGRRVASQAVGELGPGRHVVLLQGGSRLTPGVYSIRMVQGDQVRLARGVVVR